MGFVIDLDGGGPHSYWTTAFHGVLIGLAFNAILVASLGILYLAANRLRPVIQRAHLRGSLCAPQFRRSRSPFTR